MKQGRKGVVQSILAGRGATRRLLDLGITPGQEVEVLQSGPFLGPIRVRVRGSDMAIGRGIATRILVEITEDDSQANG